ncbi:MAG: hypothetical protein ACOX60_06705 [Massiliimalia sp.]|jgi:hypothetical protein
MNHTNRSFTAGAAGAILCIGGIFFSKQLAQGIQNGIEICCVSLIPSLFFFLVLSGLISKTKMGIGLCAPFAQMIRRILPVTFSGASIFFFSIIGGYPVGAQLIRQKISDHSITPKEGSYLLCFCVNCSPAFLISGISVRFWNSISAGIILYLSQVLAAIITAWLAGRKQPRLCSVSTASSLSVTPISAALVESVSQGIHSMSMICGFVLLFCGGFSILDGYPIPEQMSIALKGILEVTSGCQQLGLLSPKPGVLTAAALTSFGGICVFCQISAMIGDSGVSLKGFLLWRWFYTLCSILLTQAGMMIFQPKLEPAAISTLGGTGWSAYSVSPSSAICFLLFGAATVLFLAERAVPAPNRLRRVSYK